MRVVELWRYPIKSMLGERLDEATVGPVGMDGDRRRAVVDRDSGVSLSAKRYGALLTCRARTVDDGVIIEFSDGERIDADSPRAGDRLSHLLERPVAVATRSHEQPIRHEFPTEISTGEGEPFLHEPGLEAFFDRAPLHLLTTATLAELRRIRPESMFTRARFRPNILAEVNGTGFIEDAWVGAELRIGAASLVAIDRKPRCVMTTRPQGDLVRDPGVLRTVAEANEGNAGIELRAGTSGIIRIGDPVELVR